MRYIICVILSVVISACGVASSEARLLKGGWRSSDPDMIAYISKHQITIYFDLDDGDRGLYWKGTAPASIRNGKSFRSIADKEALDMSLFGSVAKTKKFVYKDRTLTFSLTALGITRKVVLHKR